MAIRADHIIRVVIDNEWFSVEPGTFEVVEMAFTDDTGEATHEPLGTHAYSFITPTGDRYYGPIAAISLFKLADL
jgi:hypothetical protein